MLNSALGNSIQSRVECRKNWILDMKLDFGLVCLFGILTGVFYSVGVVNAQEHKHTNNDKNSSYFIGDQDFEAKRKYELVLRSDEGRAEMASKRQQKLPQGHRVALRSKSLAEKQNVYLELLEELPANTVFRVVEAEDTESGDIRVSIETAGQLTDLSKITSSKILDLDVAQNPDIIRVIQGPDLAIKSLDFPPKWTKESSYEMLLSHFDSGAKLQKVSVVFDLSNDLGTPFGQLSFSETMQTLRFQNLGVIYGYGSDEDRKIAWWTQDLSKAQIDQIKLASSVIGFVAHD